MLPKVNLNFIYLTCENSQARGDVSSSISNCDEILGPLQDFTEDMGVVEDYVKEARSLMEEYGNSDKDVESLYQKHQVRCDFCNIVIKP